MNASAKAMLPHGAHEWLLVLVGINIMLLHFLLVQHITVAIRQDEIAVIIFSLSFFSGISLGYALAGRLPLVWIRNLWPVLLLGQMLIFVTAQVVTHVVTHDVGQWATRHGLPWEVGIWANNVLITIWTTLGTASMYSIFLPAIIEQEGGRMRRCYSLELAGSLVGLLLIPLLAGISRTWLLAGYFCIFLGIAMLLKTRKSVLVCALALMVLYLCRHDAWDKQCATWFYRRQYASSNVDRVVHTQYTPYHKIEVLQLKDQEYMLVLNGKRQFAKGSHHTYSYFVAEYPARLLGAPCVCLLGCGSMSTVGRIGDIATSIDIVDLDKAVFTTGRRFFQKYNRLDALGNWSFRADDAKHYMANTQDCFDLILHDIPPARSRQTAMTYTAEFFSIVKQRLTARGVFSISALNVRSHEGYGQKMIATLSHIFDHYYILAYRGSYYFFGGGPGMREYDTETLRNAIRHHGKDHVRILNRTAIDSMVAGIEIITVNNVGALIYD